MTDQKKNDKERLKHQSFYPLEFDDVVKALLDTPPEKKENGSSEKPKHPKRQS